MRAKVDAFAKAHPRFDELGSMIELYLRDGLDLKAAYRAAVAFDALKRKPIRGNLLRAALKRAMKRLKTEARTNSP